MTEMRPQPSDRLLDVGITNTTLRASNFMEAMYPWRGQITAVSAEASNYFEAAFPEIDVVHADGRALPFADRSFDIGFSNAVVEHVGSRIHQRQFIEEMLRVCQRVFIATPNARFPVDPHTLLPFVHWAPRRLRHPILRATSHGYWVGEERLNLLSAGEFVRLFPATSRPRLIRQRLLGMTSVATVIAG